MLAQQIARNEHALHTVRLAMQAVHAIPISDITVATRQRMLGQLVGLEAALAVEAKGGA
jgi:hypothetical protein